MSDPLLLAFAALTFVLGGFVKGVIGLGLPIVGVGLLGAVMPTAQAAALLVVPSLVTNVWQGLAGPNAWTLTRRLWTMLLGIALGTLASVGFLAGDDTGAAKAGLGAALALYGLVGLARVRLTVEARREPWMSPLMGGLTGLVTGATGVFAIPAAPYLQAIGLGRDDLVQSLGLSFTIATLFLFAGLAWQGAFSLAIGGWSVAALAPALAGLVLGQRLRRRLSLEAFRRWFFAGLVGLGGYLALDSLARIV